MAAQFRRDVARPVDALPLVLEHLQVSAAVNQGHIGNATPIDVAVGEAGHPIDALERLDGRERAVAIVSQNYRLAVRHAQNNVQVSIQIEVEGPCSRV